MNKQKSYRWKKLELGTCYYPEHWKKDLWADDLARMKENGIGTVRIAEFAWNKIEPKEGQFSFDFFDEFLDLAKKMEIRVIFCTPTATPPAWLTTRYPEVLNARIDGVKFRHGMRWHYNYNSKKYQELCARLVTAMGEHYAPHPAIVGWQIDNEFNGEVDVFYSESDTEAFRVFLQEKYETLENLNNAWGTVFWNQTYTSWEEIYVPRITPQNSTNPHEMLDYIRFVSDSAIRFCKLQSDILRRFIKPGDFITTNGMYRNINHHKMTVDCLDVYMYDSYPNYGYGFDREQIAETEFRDRMWSRDLSIVRSISPHFGIMEQQSGAQGWNTMFESPSPKPGQMMLWAMQSVAHGADYLSFFRWRTSIMGTEIYWHGILDYDNRQNRRLDEVHDIWKRVSSIEDVTGGDYQSSVGIINDYSNIWDAQIDVWHHRIAADSEEELFKALQITHTPMDFVYLEEINEEEDLGKYKVLIYPHPMILSDKCASLLREYVKRGGYLIFGARAGLKDENGKCVMTPMPGLLSDLSGSNVTDFSFVGTVDELSSMEWEGKVIRTGVFSDILEADQENSKVLAVYTSDYYKGKPALIEHVYGKGRVLHFGGTFTRENAIAVLAYLDVLEPYKDLIDLPESCEISVRKNENGSFLFVLNYAREGKKIHLKKAVCDLDDNTQVQGEILLKPFETKVYRI